MTQRLHWWYHDERGCRIFQHFRYPHTPTPEDPRTKGYGYRYLVADNDWIYRKPNDADRFIYGLPRVLANSEAKLVLTEGERCADSALARGVLATSHHGGAGKFTEAMAESLSRHRGPIVLVADNDPAGALDVCRRFDLLRDVGISAGRLRVREVMPTHKGADLRDHFEAGYGMRALRRSDIDRLREIAATVRGDCSEGSWGVTPKEIAQLHRWRPKTERRSGSREIAPAPNAGVIS
jgi:hypothetical protein